VARFGAIILFLLSAAAFADDGYLHHGNDHVPIFGHGEQNPEDWEIPAGSRSRVHAGVVKSHRYVRVYGRLDVEGELQCHTLQILPGGEVRLYGMVSIKPGPLDTDQFGRGVLNHGKLVITGQPKLRLAIPARDARAGQATIRFRQQLDGWRPGDELVFADTRHIDYPRPYPFTEPVDLLPQNQWEQCEKVRVAAVSGDTVTLERPLQFDHEATFTPNLTRSAVIRSLDKTQRGHVQSFSGARFVGTNCEFRDLGRTTTELLDPVANHVGRYVVHWHRTTIPHTLDNFSINESPGWGLAIHGSSFNKLTNGVSYNCRGSHLVTEDGSENDNEIRNHVAILATGSGEWITARSNTKATATGERLWHIGTGYGLTNADSKIHNNLALNCQFGFGIAGHGSLTLPRRRKDGTKGWWIFENWQAYPIHRFTDNKAHWCGIGIETWNTPATAKIPFRRFTANHCGRGVHNLNTSSANYFKDCKFTNCTYGVTFKPGYERHVTLDGCQFVGCDYGYRQIWTTGTLNIKGCTFDCKVACIDQPAGHRCVSPLECVVEDSTFRGPKWLGTASQYSWLVDVTGIALTQSKDSVKIGTWPTVWHWRNVNGESFRLYHREQVPEWPIPGDGQWLDFQGDGLTNGEMYDAFGVCLFGEFAPQSAATRPELPGFLIGPPKPYPFPQITDGERTGNVVALQTNVPCRAAVRYMTVDSRWRFTDWTEPGTSHAVTVDDPAWDGGQLWPYAQTTAGEFSDTAISFP
jgi:hypothetical protein